MSKPKIKGALLVAKAYPLIEEALSVAARRAWYRAHKHVERPTEEQMCAAFEEAAMNEICERFDFPELEEVE